MQCVCAFEELILVPLTTKNLPHTYHTNGLQLSIMKDGYRVIARSRRTRPDQVGAGMRLVQTDNAAMVVAATEGAAYRSVDVLMLGCIVWITCGFIL